MIHRSSAVDRCSARLERPLFLLVISVCALALLPSCTRYLEERIDSPALDGAAVTFRVRSPAARTVQVAADFNNWGRGDAEMGEVLVGLMERRDDGVWELTMELPPGRYRYRFIIDESSLILDPLNPRVVDDGMGGKANLLIMP